MNPEIRELYQEVVLEHGKNPRNFQKLATANRKADGVNPLCGDKLTVFVEFADDTIVDVTFEGCGCAISMASASLMTEKLKGLSRDAAINIFENFHQLMVAEEVGEVDFSALGKLEVLTGVREFPMRVKCATLAWHTFKNALENSDQTASTE